jgi:hypothetical protein
MAEISNSRYFSQEAYERSPVLLRAVADAESGLARGLAHFRGFIILLSLVGVLFIAGVYVARQQIDPVLQHLAEQKINALLHERGASAEIGAVRFVEGHGITISEVEIIDQATQLRMARVEKVFVPCQLSHVELINKKFQPERVVVSGLQIDARRSVTGWNIQKLFQQPQTPLQLVPIEIHNARLQVFYGEDPDALADVELEKIELQISPRSPPQSTSDPAERSEKSENDSVASLAFLGSFHSSDSGKVQFAGSIHPQTEQWGIAIQAPNLRISRDLQRRCPPEWIERVEMLDSINGRIDCHLQLSGTTFKQLPQFHAQGKIIDGRIDDPRLPTPLSQISANFELDNQHIVVNEILADSTLGPIKLNFEKQSLLDPAGNLTSSPIVLRAKSRELFLNDRLAQSLPVPLQKEWRKFLPAGPVNIDARLEFADGKWQHDLTIELLDVAATYYRLPYRLEGCRGRIECHNRNCSFNITGLAAGALVRFDGHYENLGPDMIGEMNFDVEGLVPIDEKLFNALRPNPELYDIVRSYRPTGMMSAQGKIWRTRAANGEILDRKDYAIQISDATAVYEHFPYPVSGVTGTFRIKDENVYYQNIEGSKGAGYFVCNGSLTPRDGLQLTFHCQTIDFEEELKAAMSEGIQSAWDSLRPRGSIDQATVVLNRPPNSELRINVRLAKFKPTPGIERDLLSVNPVWFPYKVNEVVGTVDYENGKLTIHQLAGNHGETKVTISGNGQFNDTDWFVNLQRINFDRLQADRDFIAALPENLGQAALQMQIKGMLGIDGSMVISGKQEEVEIAKVAYLSEINAQSTRSASLAQIPNFRWDLQVDMADGSLLTGLPLTHIYGGARFIGTSDANEFYSSGRMEIDSLLCNGWPLTNVVGPVWVDATRIGLGSWAVPVKVESDRQLLTADLFGGKLTFDALVALEQNMPFQIQARIDQADLAHAMQELSPTTEDIQGTCYAGVKLIGDSRGTHTYRGNGSARLTSAKISEVPVMLAMLKLLSVKQVDRTAFNESNIDFAIEGDHCYFNRLEFLGDAISLKGNGEMSFDQDIKLNFYTGVGKDSFRIPVISPLMGAASQRVLLVQVDGSLSQPRVTKELFPALNDTLREMFPDLENEIRSAQNRSTESGFGRGLR